MITREELIEKAARAIWGAENEYAAWVDESDSAKDAYRHDARLVIRIALEAAAEVADERAIKAIDDNGWRTGSNIARAIRSLIPENEDG